MGKRGSGKPLPASKCHRGKMMNDEGDVGFAASSGDLVPPRAEIPEPNVLEVDIEELEGWVSNIRKRRN